MSEVRPAAQLARENADHRAELVTFGATNAKVIAPTMPTFETDLNASNTAFGPKMFFAR